MDIGQIVVHLAHGVTTIARCDESPHGLRLTPAQNAEHLHEQARDWLVSQEIGLNEDGLYLCSDELQIEAQFPPITLPGDAITYAEARDILYPDLSPNAGWQRVHRDAEGGALQVYRVGSPQRVTRYVSRAQVLALAASRRATESTGAP